jgi:drug/metabolite transporter (DMT)-like permease
VRHRVPPDLLLLATVLLWSFNFVATKYGLENGFEPLSFAAIRFGLAGVSFAAFTRAHEGTLRVDRRTFVLLVGLAGVGIFVNQLGFIYSVRLTSSVATVALLFGTLPIFVGLFARLLGIEQLDRRHWAATAISFAGVALVTAGASGGLGGDLGGILCGLLAASTWALYSLAMGPLMRRWSPYRLSAIVLVAGSVPLFATAIPQLLSQDWGDVGRLAWLALVYATFGSLVLTNISWFTAIERVGAARASIYANLQPFLGALFAYLALSEGLSAIQVAGGVVIAAGVLVARRSAPTAAVVD